MPRCLAVLYDELGRHATPVVEVVVEIRQTYVARVYEPEEALVGDEGPAGAKPEDILYVFVGETRTDHDKKKKTRHGGGGRRYIRGGRSDERHARGEDDQHQAFCIKFIHAHACGEQSKGGER